MDLFYYHQTWFYSNQMNDETSLRDFKFKWPRANFKAFHPSLFHFNDQQNLLSVCYSQEQFCQIWLFSNFSNSLFQVYFINQSKEFIKLFKSNFPSLLFKFTFKIFILQVYFNKFWHFIKRFNLKSSKYMILRNYFSISREFQHIFKMS